MAQKVNFLIKLVSNKPQDYLNRRLRKHVLFREVELCWDPPVDEKERWWVQEGGIGGLM
jgi:hypothetical protein